MHTQTTTGGSRENHGSQPMGLGPLLGSNDAFTGEHGKTQIFALRFVTAKLEL